MSDETKKPFDLGPILPMFGAGVDLGERLGAMDARLKQLEAGQVEIKRDLKELDAKFEAKTDKMAYALNRLDERTRLMMVLGGGLWITVIAGFILQFFSK